MATSAMLPCSSTRQASFAQLLQRLPTNWSAPPAADPLQQCGELSELYLDRGDVGDEAIDARRHDGMAVFCKPFPLHDGGRFTKADFTIDLESGRIRRPQGVSVGAHVGAVARFEPTSALSVRNVTCAPARSGSRTQRHFSSSEPLLIQLRQQARTLQGRTVLRQRIAVEHRLAAIHNRQGIALAAAGSAR